MMVSHTTPDPTKKAFCNVLQLEREFSFPIVIEFDAVAILAPAGELLHSMNNDRPFSVNEIFCALFLNHLLT